jgi:type IX secretion system substrate protein
MRFLFVQLLVLTFCHIAFPQAKYDYVWLSGTTPEDTTSFYGTNVMSFNYDTLEIEKQFLDTYFSVTNASVCDENGNLLFYTNGCYIADASHQIMENGNVLNPGSLYNSNCPDKGYRSSNGAIVLPQPGSSNNYFLFHTAKTIGAASPFLIYHDKLYYTVVDMSLNNNLGAVTAKNQVIIQDSLNGSVLSAVRHTNNQDWWVLLSKAHENKYFKVLFTANGVESVTEQKIGMNPNPWGNGQGCFSPDGTKFASYNSYDNVFLFDFDRSTGELSNFQQIFADTTDSYVGGLAFSPNSRYLYVSTRNKLWQFDTEVADIQASQILIGEYDGYKFLNLSPVTFFRMRLGPDCRIYMIASNSARHLHIIRYPDNPGLACGFEQRGVPLPAVNNFSQPNFPNYRLGTPYPLCDSSIVVGAPLVFQPQGEVRVFPNPAKEEVHIALPAPMSGEWVLFNQLGRVVRREVLPPGQPELSVMLNGVSPGLYFWQVRAEGRQVGSGKLIVLE